MVPPHRAPMHITCTTIDTTTTESSTTSRHTAMASQLRREWQRMRRRPDLLAAVRSWGLVEDAHEVHDLEDVLTLAGYQCAPSARTEDVLRRLVERAVVDELAARIVLQRILPGLLAVVRRRSPAGRVSGVLEELVGAAWITIRTYDVRRRPACLAAALICGAEHQAFRRPLRSRASLEVPVDPRRVAPPARRHESAADELAEVLRWARLQGLSADDAEFVRRIVSAESPQELAAQLGVTTRTVRNRRDRVTYRLRRLSVAA
jgi:DNA-binding CsgD family transcriptional regulator